MTSRIDIDLATVDWVIDYPAAAAVFDEFGIDYCCGGKSLAFACKQAGVHPDMVRSKLRVIVERAPYALAQEAARSLREWVERSPPGWISATPAAQADPLAIAAEVRDRLQAVVTWLQRPDHERWDAYELQSLSAALFNRYAAEGLARAGGRSHVGLLQLAWPAGSEAIQYCLAELQQRLIAPLAVYKAARLPLRRERCPTAAEFAAAERELLTQRNELAAAAARLAAALQACGATRQAEQAHPH
jgi:hypothetical protein